MKPVNYEEAVRTVFNMDKVLGVVLFVIALMVLYILIGNVIKTTRELRKPQEKEETEHKNHQLECEERFRSDYSRLQVHDAALADIYDALQALFVCQKALVNHALHDGNTAELQNANGVMDAWLLKRPNRNAANLAQNRQR